MKKYKGYYIDNVTFSSKKEIDEFIKNDMIKHIKKLLKIMATNPVAASEITLYEKALHNEFGLTCDEIEELEFA